mgnify:FL=1
MQGYDYLGINTLHFDAEKCVGCGMCLTVCPHAVFVKGDGNLKGGKVALDKPSKCMECGACAINCPVAAITVTPGVGCASAILHSWITGEEASCDCSGGGCC